MKNTRESFNFDYQSQW